MSYWITTFSGRTLDYINPSVGAIHIDDIALHLSRMPRFSGATKRFYSVAQHSCGVERIVRALYGKDSYTLRYEALLHDAHEAYLGDVPAPLKRAINNIGGFGTGLPHNDFDKIAAKIDSAIRKALQLGDLEPEPVRFADRVALLLEATSRNVRKNVAKWPPGMFDHTHAEAVHRLPAEYIAFINMPLPEHRARNKFLSTFKELTHALKIKVPAAQVGDGQKRGSAVPHQEEQIANLGTKA